MAQIHHVTGDVTKPVTETFIVAHVCNNSGAWGAGVSGAISRAFPLAEQRYRRQYRLEGGGPATMPFEHGNHRLTLWLGHVVYAELAWKQRYVANMIAQDGIRTQPGARLLDYNALTSCLISVGRVATLGHMSVHIPHGMGAGLAGGDWERIIGMVEEILVQRAGVEVYVYRLEVTR